MKKYRISNMKRFMCFIMVLTTVLLCSAGLFILNYFSDKESVTVANYTVCNNDTLWSIAKSIDSGKDVREVIYTIEKMNGWDTTPVIHPGDCIAVPVYN